MILLRRRLALALAFTVGLAAVSRAPARADTPPPLAASLWEVVDIPLTASADLAAPLDAEVLATLRHADGATTLRVPAFHDGGRRWILRVCPPRPGRWLLQPDTAPPELTIEPRTLEVSPDPVPARRGPIGLDPAAPDRLAYADGSPCLLLAYECDWLFTLDSHDDPALPKTSALLPWIREHGFNQIVFNLFAYDAPWGDRSAIRPGDNLARPCVFPFGGDNTRPDHSTLNLAYFRHLDHVFERLQAADLSARFMIYVWNKKVAWPRPGSPEDDRFFDYVVKRYQAYPHLVWDVSKEALSYDHVGADYIAGRVARLRALDAHRRLLTVHDVAFCERHPELVDLISVQDWKPQIHATMTDLAARHPGRPIMNIEHGGYERAPHAPAIFDGAYIDPIVCLDRVWQCLFAGVHATHYWQRQAWYELVPDPWNLPPDQRPALDYYRHLRAFFDEFDFNRLRPLDAPFAPFCLTDSRRVWTFYLGAGAISVQGDVKALSGRAVRVRWFDPLTGRWYPQPDRQLRPGGWLAFPRPDSLSGPMGILVLETTDPELAAG